MNIVNFGEACSCLQISNFGYGTQTALSFARLILENKDPRDWDKTSIGDHKIICGIVADYQRESLEVLKTLGFKVAFSNKGTNYSPHPGSTANLVYANPKELWTNCQKIVEDDEKAKALLAKAK